MKLLLIDANSLIHRCYHALPPFTNKAGEPTGALYGLASILLRIVREKESLPLYNNNSEYIAAFFDRPEPTFREEKFKEYKIHRPPTEEALAHQINESRNLFAAFNIQTFELAGYESDDLIGTAVKKYKETPDIKIIILTADTDMMQLVENEKIVVESTQKGISETTIYNEEKVIEKYGLKPTQLTNYKGLVGDTSDNIPGVKGIGPKTAAPLIQKYGTLENFFEHGKKEKSHEKILAEKEKALLSRELATIHCDAPLEINLDDLKYAGLPKKQLTDYFEKMGFQTLLKRI